MTSMKMQNIHTFTSITTNYLPKARVLAQSIKRFHPDINFHLLLSDAIPEWLVIENEPFDSIITIQELPIPELKSWIFKHTLVEMCTGVKGIAFKEIIRRYDNCDKVLYFDPDMVVFSPLDRLIDNFNSHSILLTPHQTEPENSHAAIIDNEICSLKHGVYNLGFLGIKNSTEGTQFIDWWSNRCLDYCYDNIPGGLFTDQRWVDLAPAFFTGICILRDVVYNVATWNITNRIVTGSLETEILVNGEPLCFYHFSGFDSGAQEVMLKKYGSSSPVLFQLRKWYIEQCELSGQSKLGKIPCVYSSFDNGELISKKQRFIYRHRLDLQKAYPNPFSTDDFNNSYLNWHINNGQDVFIGETENLLELQAELEKAKALVTGMESSKFWKLREFWFKLKRLPELILKLFRKVKTSLIYVKNLLKNGNSLKKKIIATKKVS